MNSSDAKQYDLPANGTADRETLVGLKRGLCQEVEGLKQQIQGKRQQISAIERTLNGGQKGDS